MSNRYKLIAGSHIEGSRQFNQGDTVTSTRNLAELFPGKFQDMGAATPVRPLAPIPPASETPKAAVNLPAEVPPALEDDSDWDALPKAPAPKTRKR